MKINDNILFWLENASEDLDTAITIFDTKKYIWSLYIGHLSLEKCIKALIISKTNILIPPKIHNLLKLCEIAEIHLSDEQIDILGDINRFQIEARYPEYKNDLQKIANFDFTKHYLEEIKKLFLWFKSQIIL